MLQDLLNTNIFDFLLIFTRVGSAMGVMPGFSAPYVSLRARLILALTVSFAMMPMIAPHLPGMPTAPANLALLLGGEAIVGLFLGLIPFILMAALQTAGTVFSFVASLSNAFVVDPVVEQQSSILSSFMGITAITLIFVTNLHYWMLSAIVDSYTLFVPGQILPWGDMAQTMGRVTMDSFALGIQLSSPLLVAGLAYYIGLGLLGRLMPQLPVFFFGLPIQVTMQISLLMITISGIMLVFLRHFQDGLTRFLSP